MVKEYLQSEQYPQHQLCANGHASDMRVMTMTVWQRQDESKDKTKIEKKNKDIKEKQRQKRIRGCPHITIIHIIIIKC